MNQQDTQMQPLDTNISDAANLIRQSQKICILTGAGISAESGIPTFRDKQTGLWENYRAEDLANIAAFERDPKMVWAWYQWRRGLVEDKQPNAAHYAVAKWQRWAAASNERHPIQQVILITQNVDNLHEQANDEIELSPDKLSDHTITRIAEKSTTSGELNESDDINLSSTIRVTHLHGHLWRNKCSDCETPYEKEVDYDNTDELLICDQCGGYIRPDIVWFGEGLPQAQWMLAETASAECDVFLSIGTSSLVYPAAGLASTAKQNGAAIIEVNLNPTDNPLVDIVLAGKAGEILPKLISQIMQ